MLHTILCVVDSMGAQHTVDEPLTVHTFAPRRDVRLRWIREGGELLAAVVFSGAHCGLSQSEAVGAVMEGRWGAFIVVSVRWLLW